MPARGFRHLPRLEIEHRQRSVARVQDAAIRWLQGELDESYVFSSLTAASIRQDAEANGISPEWLIGYLYGIALALDEALHDEYKWMVLSG